MRVGGGTIETGVLGSRPVPSPPAPTSPRLVYVAGAHRSGATSLGAVMAGNPGIFFAGELYRIPHPIFEVPDARRLCSCGLAADDCPFWNEVRSRLGSEPGMLQALHRGQLRFESWRWLLRTAWKRARRDPELLDHLARVGRFVRVLSEVSGSPLVLESSYNPVRGWLYRDPATGLDVRFIHLVRDGRNFIASEQHATDPPEAHWRWIRSTPVVVGRWVAYNVLSILLLRPTGRCLRVRYEDFVRSTGTVLSQISRFIGVDLSDVARQVESGAAIPMRHVAAGNRMRLEGAVRLEPHFAETPSLSTGSLVAFWGLAGWLALSLGYRPASSTVPRAPTAESTT
jgi:hypothetical protein